MMHFLAIYTEGVPHNPKPKFFHTKIDFTIKHTTFVLALPNATHYYIKNQAIMKIASFLMFTFCFLSCGQETNNSNYTIFTFSETQKFEVANRELSLFSEDNKKGLRFSKKKGDGVAWLQGAEFSNGTVEVDIRGKDILQQSFVGIAFHGVDSKTFDAVYFRPFNFHSTDSVRRIHAVQYVSHPNFTWKKLRDNNNGQYEKAVLSPPNANDWFHAKIVIDYPQVTVFVNGSLEPSLTVDQLSDRKKGKIGFWVGDDSDGDFANLQITKKE